MTSCCARPCEAPGGPGHVSAAPQASVSHSRALPAQILILPVASGCGGQGGLGEEAVPIEPFCPSRHLLEMRMKLSVPHGQQGGAFAFLCSQVLAGVGSFHLFTLLGPAWQNPPSPDAGQSSRRLTTAPPQGSPLLWSPVLARLSSQPPPHGTGSPSRWRFPEDQETGTSRDAASLVGFQRGCVCPTFTPLASS